MLERMREDMVNSQGGEVLIGEGSNCLGLEKVRRLSSKCQKITPIQPLPEVPRLLPFWELIR